MRKFPLLVALSCVMLGVGAAGAGAAAPRVLHADHLLSGPSITLPCANPANHDLVGRVLGAVRVTVGGSMQCLGQAVRAAGRAGPLVTSGPVGLEPSQIQSAYGLASAAASDGSGETVAIVDAYNDPNASVDLAVFRSTYGLPACTTDNGCLTIENASGETTPLPQNDAGWSEEISLDLDTVSSTCPLCHILLVEASSASTSALETAEDTAAGGADVVAISNSYGASESSSELTGDAAYDHPGIAITASAGDDGYGVEWPASSPYVTAVGGTTLTQAAGTARGWTETAWDDTGSGCSAYEPQPAWQSALTRITSVCAERANNDVSADANPDSGLGIYDTYNTCSSSGSCNLQIELGLAKGLDGWAQVGSTSLASPLIASVYALADNTVSAGSYPYSHTSSLNDIKSGSNGKCKSSDLCTAGTGWDGPTGLGTPSGTGAF